MAEGLLRAFAPDRYDAVSAGVEAGSPRPEAVTVMREVGIDVSGQRSKAASEFAGQSFDVVVTTCDEAKEACPFFPGAKRVLHWGFPDPAAIEGTRSNDSPPSARCATGCETRSSGSSARRADGDSLACATPERSDRDGEHDDGHGQAGDGDEPQLIDALA